MTTESEYHPAASAGTAAGPTTISPDIPCAVANPRRTKWNSKSGRVTAEFHGRASRRPLAH